MLRAGRGFGKLAWKGVKLEVWAFAMLMLQLLLFLSFLMVVEEILPVPGRGPPRQGGLPVSLSQKPEGLGLGLAAAFVLGDAASWLGIWVPCLEACFSGSGKRFLASRTNSARQGASEAGGLTPRTGKLMRCLPEPGLGASGPGNTTTGGGEAPLGEARKTSQKEVAMFCPKVWGRPDGFLASDLPGPPRRPQLPPAGGLLAPELPRLPASVRSPCSTAPGTLSLGFTEPCTQDPKKPHTTPKEQVQAWSYRTSRKPGHVE